MTKKDVLEQKLFTYVVQSSSVDSLVGVQEWWDRLSDSDEVEVKYPYERHDLRRYVMSKFRSKWGVRVVSRYVMKSQHLRPACHVLRA